MLCMHSRIGAGDGMAKQKPLPVRPIAEADVGCIRDADLRRGQGAEVRGHWSDIVCCGKDECTGSEQPEEPSALGWGRQPRLEVFHGAKGRHRKEEDGGPKALVQLYRTNGSGTRPSHMIYMCYILD